MPCRRQRHQLARRGARESGANRVGTVPLVEGNNHSGVLVPCAAQGLLLRVSPIGGPVGLREQLLVRGINVLLPPPNRQMGHGQNSVGDEVTRLNARAGILNPVVGAKPKLGREDRAKRAALPAGALVGDKRLRVNGFLHRHHRYHRKHTRRVTLRGLRIAWDDQ